MRLKTLGRVGGAVNATVWSTLGYFLYQTISNVDYNGLKNIILENHPIEYKVLSGVVLGLTGVLSISFPLVGFGIADGLVDIAKGTHHYFGCRVWQKFTKNSETKKEIESDLERQLVRIEEDI